VVYGVKLTKQSVINISQIYTVDKGDLGNKIGTLGPERILEVLDGIKLILMPKDIGPGIDAAIEREDERYRDLESCYLMP